MGQIKAKSNMRLHEATRCGTFRRVRTTDSLSDMKACFNDLWLDTQERPRILAAHKAVRAMIRRHLDDWEDLGAEREFIHLQKEIDRGLKLDDIDGVIIPAQKKLDRIYGLLFRGVFGSRK